MPEVGEAVEPRVHRDPEPEQHDRGEPVVHQTHRPHRQAADGAHLDVGVKGTKVFFWFAMIN
jgi:hypothetical protein